jgi:PAS domain S-box-containing protein
METRDYQELRRLLDDYLRMYSSRDDRLTGYFSQDFSGFTGGGDFLVKDREAWIAITRQDFAQVKDPIQIELKDLTIQSLAENIAVATSFFTIHLPIEDHVLSRETARLVLIFRKEAGGWKIAHSSISIPYGLVREGEVYPLQELAVRNQYLEGLVAERTVQLSEANSNLQQANRDLAREISEHTQAEEALRKNQQLYDNLVSKISVGVFSLHCAPDGTGTLSYVSPKLAEMLQVSAQSMLADYHMFFRSIHPEDIDSLLLLKQKGIEERQPFDWEGRVLVEGGVKWLHLNSSPEALADGGLLWHGVVTDITERKQAEADRLRLEKLLFHAQKLESLGVLAGGIAHDFNNILMAIMGNADLAAMRLGEESPARENLRRIEQAAARAADLTRQMLAYSGKGKFVIEDLDLNLLLEKMLPMLEITLSKHVHLQLDLQRPLPSLEADATQMNQIIMNLAINAAEALGEGGGVIEISTGCLECDAQYLKANWPDEQLSVGLYLSLEVADTGCGMTTETMAKLFDPFFSTKFAGRGLGMAAVLGIVKGHGGAIRVCSEPGKGTTFKVVLPSSGRPGDLVRPESLAGDWQGSGSVLLVDDEEAVRGVGVAMLQELGLIPITANDGWEAIRVFQENPGVAFVILDLTMPRMDGEQCLRELRKLDPAVKVIISSGYNEQDVTQRFVGKVLSGFIQKPYRLAALREAIRSIL